MFLSEEFVEPFSLIEWREFHSQQVTLVLLDNCKSNETLRVQWHRQTKLVGARVNRRKNFNLRSTQRQLPEPQVKRMTIKQSTDILTRGLVCLASEAGSFVICGQGFERKEFLFVLSELIRFIRLELDAERSLETATAVCATT